MGDIQVSYREEIVKAMEMLCKDRRVIFLGQSIRYPGHAMFGTLEKVPMFRRIELPVFEDVQMGMSIGLSLEGYIPISIYPRMDFLIIAINQLVNNLDKIEEMSCEQFKPKVIIRTMVGSKVPLDGGPQHTQDHTEALRHLLTNVDVYKLTESKSVVSAYLKALESVRSTILVEMSDLY